MSRIPRRLARRLDRLARRAHAFHRFAHHPLCQAYAGELVRLGRRTRICKGCLLTALGAVAGAAAGLLLPALPAVALGPGALLFAAVAAAATAAPRPGSGGRAGKWLTRGLPVALGSCLAVAGLCRRDPAGVALAVAAAATVALAVMRYRRRGPDRGPCRACPEAAGPSACSGVRPQLRRERAFRRLAGTLLDAAMPPSIRARPPGVGEGGT